MATSLTHRYIPRTEQTEENLFMEEYYSSTDTKIYIDDVEQTEIAYISYSLQEQLKPLYGYASRTFDDVAVGNRIVTGTFKVPIKNPEAQSPMYDIIRRSQNNTLEDYNNNQQELMDAVEWITEQQITNSDTVYVESDEVFEYRTKLINLGYDLDYNSSKFILEQQIKRFQAAHNLDANGILTTETKKEIDKAVAESNNQIISIPANTKLYLGPSPSFAYEVLNEPQDVYVLDNWNDGWIYVMTKDGVEGYIET